MNDLITPEDISNAEKSGVLSPSFFTSQRLLDQFFNSEINNTDSFCKKLVDKLKIELEETAKNIANDIYNETLESFQEYLFLDAKSNLQSQVFRQVDDIITALLTNQEWAYKTYILGAESKYHNGEKVREELVKLIPKELQDARISDLENQVAKLKRRLFLQ